MPALLGGLGGLLMLAHPVLTIRVFLSRRRAGDAAGDAALFASFCVLGKLPELIGALSFYRNRNRERHLIEYK